MMREGAKESSFELGSAKMRSRGGESGVAYSERTAGCFKIFLHLAVN